MTATNDIVAITTNVDRYELGTSTESVEVIRETQTQNVYYNFDTKNLIIDCGEF